MHSVNQRAVCKKDLRGTAELLLLLDLTPQYAAYSPGTPVYREGEGKADSNRKVQFVPHSVHRLLRGRRKLERSTSQMYLLVA